MDKIELVYDPETDVYFVTVEDKTVSIWEGQINQHKGLWFCCSGELRGHDAIKKTGPAYKYNNFLAAQTKAFELLGVLDE